MTNNESTVIDLPNHKEWREELKSYLVKPTIDAAADALIIAMQFGAYDGDHHKRWVIDQMCRVLTGKNYDSFVQAMTTGEDGTTDAYEWDTGIAP